MTDIVNIGSSPNAGDGDTLRAMAIKMNNRFFQFEGNISLNERFYGEAAVDPLNRPAGGALQNGDWYWNTAVGRMKVRVGGVWILTPDVVAEDLAQPTGADNVGFGVGTPNAIASNSGRKLRETVSIGDFGGRDDFDGTTPITNSLAAFTKIFADYPDGCRIRLPRTDTGIYYLSGNDARADLSQYVLDPDPGVSVHYVGTGCPLTSPGLALTRALDIRMATQGFTWPLSPNAHGDVAQKPRYLTAADGEAPQVDAFSPAASMAFFAIDAAGAQTATTGSADASGASFSGISSTGFKVGSVAIRPGQEIHAQVTMPSMTGSICAYVQTETGWASFSQSTAGGDMTRRVFESGFALQSVTYAHPLLEAAAYWMVNAEIGIRVHSPRSFSVLANHIEVARIDGLSSNIIRAGWGAGLASSAGPAYIATPCRIRHKRTMGRRPISVVVAGDSISDKANANSWVPHFRRAIAGVGGVQVKQLLNLAVSGQTSLQQRDIFLAQNLGGYDFALIAPGVNDIAGGSSPAQYVAAIEAMVAHCATYGVTPIVGVPTMFYGTADAAPYGQTGQATSGATSGAPYRLGLLRRMAELGVHVNLMQIEDDGAIIPSLLGNAAVDPVVQDNIHQTGWGGEQRGLSFAKALIGRIASPVRKDTALTTIQASWIPAAISASYGVAVKPSCQVLGDTFSLSGYMDTPAPVPDGLLVLQLPQAYAPAGTIVMPLSCAPESGTPNLMCNMQISPDGAVRVYGVPATSRYFYFGAGSWALGA